jgi:hypothetical protein
MRKALAVVAFGESLQSLRDGNSAAFAEVSVGGTVQVSGRRTAWC